MELKVPLLTKLPASVNVFGPCNVNDAPVPTVMLFMLTLDVIMMGKNGAGLLIVALSVVSVGGRPHQLPLLDQSEFIFPVQVPVG